MSVCRSCGKPIEWVVMVSGKKCPVEGDYITYDEAPPDATIVTDGGNVYKKYRDKRLPNIKGRISHFTTCPEAGTWRKR